MISGKLSLRDFMRLTSHVIDAWNLEAASDVLGEPITTHKGQITKLEFRDLTAADAIAMRHPPYTLSIKGESTAQMPKYDVAFRYIARLTGIDEISLSGLSFADFKRAIQNLMLKWDSELGE